MGKPLAAECVCVSISMAFLFCSGGCRTQVSPEPSAAAAPARVLSWGDQGNGIYANPILKADFSDPDILRVGDDFYLIASDFHFVGMQVLHSKDLVNWQYIGQVFDRLSMDSKYDQMRGYSEGTWAPALRYHNGEFYIFVCTPADGLFMWHAKNPAGPWSPTVTVKAVERWEDPCPFWDDDGQAYLVHSLRGAGPIIIHKMSPDGTKLLDDGQEVYRGPNAEGPKMHKRSGYYYISLPEGGFTAGGQSMLRSKNIYGPYERREVFSPGDGEHQGGFVDLENGESWFICFRRMNDELAAMGRICYLEPVKWAQDGWPVFGNQGKPVGTWKKPDVGKTYPIARPATSDEFDAPGLGFQWQWNHNPVNDHWSLTERRGYLRLKSLPADNLSVARNTLTQKLWDEAGIVDTRLDLSGMADGQHAGLAFMTGNRFGWLGVVRENGALRLDWNGGQGQTIAGSTIWLRGTYDHLDCHFAYSLDGKTFVEAPASFKMGFQSWKGGRPALYSYGASSGQVDIDYFRYRYGATIADAKSAD
jgi:beta-xylosidase